MVWFWGRWNFRWFGDRRELAAEFDRVATERIAVLRFFSGSLQPLWPIGKSFFGGWWTTCRFMIRRKVWGLCTVNGFFPQDCHKLVDRVVWFKRVGREVVIGGKSMALNRCRSLRGTLCEQSSDCPLRDQIGFDYPAFAFHLKCFKAVSMVSFKWLSLWALVELWAVRKVEWNELVKF